MKDNNRFKRGLLRFGSYLLTAALSASMVLAINWHFNSGSKVQSLSAEEHSALLNRLNQDKEDKDKAALKNKTAGTNEHQKLQLRLKEDATRLQKAAVKAIPSVVLIKTYNPEAGRSIFDSYFNQFEEKKDSDTQKNVYSQQYLVGEGSGIIYTSDGYIITNNHVLADGTAWQAVTTDGSVYNAKKVGSDDITDLAVLKIDAQNLEAAELGSSEDLTLAEQVIAVGNPGGEELSSTVTVGYVSALNRVINQANGASMGYIQTDTAINPGNSGGALVNLEGQVIGINTSKIGGSMYEGLGFAIPIDTALPLIQDMIKYGEIQGRVSLGVMGQFVRSQYLNEQGERIQGFLIAKVMNPELKKAGVRSDLLITQIDELKINSYQSLRNYLAGLKEGTKVTLKLFNPHDGEESEVSVTLHASYAGKAQTKIAA